MLQCCWKNGTPSQCCLQSCQRSVEHRDRVFAGSKLQSCISLCTLNASLWLRCWIECIQRCNRMLIQHDHCARGQALKRHLLIHAWKAASELTCAYRVSQNWPGWACSYGSWLLKKLKKADDGSSSTHALYALLYRRYIRRQIRMRPYAHT